MAADGSIIIEAEIDDKKAQQELSRLNRKIETLNEQIYVKQQQKMPLVEQAQRRNWTTWKTAGRFLPLRM